MSDIETTEKEREKASESQVLIIEMLQIIDKQEGMRKWKYKVKDNRFREFIMQTTIEPRDLPVTFKIGKKYLVPISFNKSGKVGNIDGRYMGLISNHEEGNVIHSIIPPEEQGGTKEIIDKITENDVGTMSIDPMGSPYSHTANAVEKKEKAKLIQLDKEIREQFLADDIPPPKPADDKLSELSNHDQRSTWQKGSRLAVTHVEGSDRNPIKTELAVVDKDHFQTMEYSDEEQILDEMKGRMIEEYAYQFMQGGKLVTGIAYAGIKHLTVSRGGYEDLDYNIRFDKERDLFVAYFKAKDISKNNIAIGMSIQAKMKRLKSGQMVLNEFAEHQAFSKARRNAYRQLMDEAPIKLFVEQWLEENKK